MKCKEATCYSACTGGCNKKGQKKRLEDPLVWVNRCTGTKSHNTATGLDEAVHPHSSFCKFDATAMAEAMNRLKVKEEGQAATSTSQMKQNQIRRGMLMAASGPEMRSLAYSLVGERECEKETAMGKKRKAEELYGCDLEQSTLNRLLQMPEFKGLHVTSCVGSAKGHHTEVIFMHESTTHLLTKTTAGDVVAVDATFCCKDKWQLLVVWATHPEVPTKQIPAFVCLMSRKVEGGYRQAFQAMKDACPKWKPKGFTCDYETAETNGFCCVFPGAEFQGCSWHMLKAVYQKMGDLRLPVPVKDMLTRLVRRCIFAPTVAEYVAAMFQLQWAVQAPAWMPDPAGLSSVFSGRLPVLPSIKVAGAAVLAQVAKFGGYFHRTWIKGEGGEKPQHNSEGSSTSTQRGWAMCFREQKKNGEMMTTNMAAENGNKKVKHAKKESRTRSNHADFMTWFFEWAVTSTIGPVVFALANRYKQRSPQKSTHSYQHRLNNGNGSPPKKRRVQEELPDPHSINDAEAIEIDLDNLRLFCSPDAEGGDEPSNKAHKKKEQQRKADFAAWLEDTHGLRQVDHGGNGQCVFLATTGTLAAASASKGLAHAPARVSEQMDLVFYYLQRHRGQWQHYFEPKGGMTINQQQDEYLRILHGYPDDVLNTWKALKKTGALCVSCV
jgi:hypothetical protein